MNTCNLQEIFDQYYDKSLGLRMLTKDQALKVGDELRCSYDWDIENDCSCYETDKSLVNGTSTIGIRRDLAYDEEEFDLFLEDYNKALAIVEKYEGEGIVFVVGESASKGDDPAESIIFKALIIGRIK